MVEYIDEAATEFVWKKGKNLISLTRSGSSWTVEFLTSSRLLGPTQTSYKATHRDAKLAAWDVMARVISACHDENEGQQVAIRAARWMRQSANPPEARA